METTKTRCEHRDHMGRVRCERTATLRVTGLRGATEGTVRDLCSRHVRRYRQMVDWFKVEEVTR